MTWMPSFTQQLVAGQPETITLGHPSVDDYLTSVGHATAVGHPRHSSAGLGPWPSKGLLTLREEAEHNPTRTGFASCKPRPRELTASADGRQP